MPLKVSRRAIAKAGLAIAAMTLTPPLAFAQNETMQEKLYGIEWHVVELGGTEPIDGHVPTMTLDKPGRTGGNTGCNTYFATATVSDNLISFSEVGSTYVACEEQIMVQEEAFFEALRLTEKFRFEEGTLELLDKDDALLVRLAATV